MIVYDEDGIVLHQGGVRAVLASMPDGYDHCVLCGMPEHGFCQQDYHRCRDNGWAFDGWWR